MDPSPTKNRRGFDGVTSIRIRYQSPPRRSMDDATALLVKDRNLGSYEPRHTPTDVCAAQDVALGKADILSSAERAASKPRRDSGVNNEAILPAKAQVSDSEDEGGDVKSWRQKPSVKPPTDEKTIKSEALDGPTLLTPSSAQVSFSSVSAHPGSDGARQPNRLTPALTDGRGRSPKRPATEELPDEAEDLPGSSRKASKTPSRPSSVVGAKRGSIKRASTPASRSSIAGTPGAEQRSPRKPRSSQPKKEDLTINGTSRLDPTASDEHVTLYRSKGQWYEVVGEGRPEWAEDEKRVPRTVPATSSRRSTGGWRDGRFPLG